MIRYPIIKDNAAVGVTAPSSGVPVDLHSMFKEACERMKEKGYEVHCGDTVWTQVKAKSAPASTRGEELNRMMRDDSIDLIIPPWGGELLIEILEHVDFVNVPEKWVLGYSDTSILLLAITLKTGVATAHGTNIVELRGEYEDDTTAMWDSVLRTKRNESVVQSSSELYQKKWDFQNPSPCVFHLTEPTQWKTITGEEVVLKGRLLGGCLDVIQHLIGTPFGNVAAFRENFIAGEPILWYFENCEMNTTSVRRALVQMKLAGWFDHCSGIMFGRSPASDPVGGYEIEDVYEQLSEELDIPVIYDIDCGHVPPQITFINGAHAVVRVENGKGSVKQTFK